MKETLNRWFKNVVYCYTHCFTFRGRDCRQVYCDFYIFLFVIGLLAAIGVWMLYRQKPEFSSSLLDYGLIAVGVVAVWTSFASCSATIRRGHDLDMSFWETWFRGKFFGIFFNHHLCRTEGSSRPNRFGPAPEENCPFSSSNDISFPDVWNG